MRFPFAVVVVAVAAFSVIGSVGGCPGASAPEEPKILGAEGRERWIVTFSGKEPDLETYREILRNEPGRADAYAEKMRGILRSAHADFEKSTEAVGVKIVEVWWMSNAMTVEVDARAVPTLQQRVGNEGVLSVTPDRRLDQFPPEASAAQ